MGTEVLYPRDCLVDRIRVPPAVFHRRKSCFGYGNPKLNSHVRKPAVRPEPKKRFSSPPDNSTNGNKPSNHSLAGQVMILRRGQSLDSVVKSSRRSSPPLKKAGDDLIVYGTGRLGPDPELVPKQIWIKESRSVPAPSPSSAGNRSDEYAGSAFSMSPSPRSLPLPTFFYKKPGSKSFDDSATRDLRRLLRLD